MPNTLLVVDDNDAFRKLISQELRDEGYRVIDVDDGRSALEVIEREQVDVMLADIVMPHMDGIELLDRALHLNPGIRTIVMTGQGTVQTVIEAFKKRACDFLSKPFRIDELRVAVETALRHHSLCDIEVVSAKANWIEILVPCDLSAVGPIHNFMAELEGDLPQDTREAIGACFREMLSNAIEHGGKCDPTQKVTIRYVRLKRAILYSIKDPGEGFDAARVSHAALANPEGQPLQHMRVRQEMGLRPGGYGILLASQMIDELVYNEKCNELIFVKYLDDAAPEH
jgi:CheY-like chemotaxis protein/anti-sigma regulatory factor (Ser/Thr protein kinase)